MTAYIVADVEVTDPTEYQTYTKQVMASLEPYSGKFIVRGGNAQTLEGGWQPQRFVIIEFPGVEQAKAWYNSPEYTAIIGIRHSAANSRMILVQGV
jgi:uncharacterized protein (DUF1330 family)